MGENSLLKARWDEQQRVEVTDSVTEAFSVHLIAVHTRNSIFRRPPFPHKQSIVIGKPSSVSNQFHVNCFYKFNVCFYKFNVCFYKFNVCFYKFNVRFYKFNVCFSCHRKIALRFVTADRLKCCELNQTAVFSSFLISPSKVFIPTKPDSLTLSTSNRLFKS